jgi:hypothetical protein
MDIAGLSSEHGARSSAARRSTTTLDRRDRRPRGGSVRSEPTHVNLGSSPSALARERAGGQTEPVASVPDTADQLQADYFLQLLTQQRRLVEHRVDEYQKAILNFEANGDVDAACNFRRMMRIEEQDRQALDGMIEKLCRRFPRRVPSETPARKRFVVR